MVKFNVELDYSRDMKIHIMINGSKRNAEWILENGI